jgi:hypothetical protein
MGLVSGEGSGIRRHGETVLAQWSGGMLNFLSELVISKSAIYITGWDFLEGEQWG